MKNTTPKGLGGSKLWLVLFQTFRAVEKIYLESLHSLGFHCITDYAILEILYSNGPMLVSSIGNEVLLTSGSITSAINRAESAGLVVRERHQADRRAVLVSLTDNGKKRFELASAKHIERLESAFNGLQRDERIMLHDLLKKCRA